MKKLITKIATLLCATAMAVTLFPSVTVQAANPTHSADGGLVIYYAPKNPTCEGFGSHAFYQCVSCGKFFFDENATQEIADASWVAIQPTGHKLSVTDAVPATCTTGGVTPTVKCTVCNKVFASATAVPMLGHQNLVTNIKTATGTKDGMITKVCLVDGIATQEVIKKASNISLEYTTATYTGTALEPMVTVKDSDGNIISADEYSIKYSDNTDIGTAIVKIIFNGTYYSGNVTKTFKIVPAATKISALKAKDKSISVEWMSQKVDTTGYQIRYSTSKSFSELKTFVVTVKDADATAAVLSKLTSGKKYYVQVRTYTVTEGKKFVSNWSKAKSVTVK